MSEVKFAATASTSKPEPRNRMELACMHPQSELARSVGAFRSESERISAREERSRNWSFAGRRPCGMRGALFSRKGRLRMSANYQARAEAEASMLLAKLAGDMEFAAIRMPVLWRTTRLLRTTPEELRGAAACVKQWSEKLKP